MKLFSLCLLAYAVCSANDPAYFEYMEKYPKTLGPLGNAAKGEIEIILDRQKMAEIEKTMQRKVGIVAEDKYWLWINDAVLFPSGKYGIYARQVWRVSLPGAGGVAVLPLLPNGKIALNRNFRHATRSWEYEIARGGIQSGETIEQAAAREAKEETGLLLDKLHLLGQMTPDTGLTSSVVPVFLAKVVSEEKSAPEESEAIASIDAFSIEEIKQGYIDGYLSVKIDGQMHKIPLRDPFLAFALFQKEIRGL